MKLIIATTFLIILRGALAKTIPSITCSDTTKKSSKNWKVSYTYSIDNENDISLGEASIDIRHVKYHQKALGVYCEWLNEFITEFTEDLSVIASHTKCSKRKDKGWILEVFDSNETNKKTIGFHFSYPIFENKNICKSLSRQLNSYISDVIVAEDIVQTAVETMQNINSSSCPKKN